jgi:hypothetical protein
MGHVAALGFLAAIFFRPHSSLNPLHAHVNFARPMRGPEARRKRLYFAVLRREAACNSAADVVSAVHAELVELLGGHEVFGT